MECDFSRVGGELLSRLWLQPPPLLLLAKATLEEAHLKRRESNGEASQQVLPPLSQPAGATPRLTTSQPWCCPTRLTDRHRHTKKRRSREQWVLTFRAQEEAARQARIDATQKRRDISEKKNNAASSSTAAAMGIGGGPKIKRKAPAPP